MISYLVKLVFLWRRNDFKSIVCKATFWAVLACLLALAFSDLRTALLAATVVAVSTAARYFWQYRCEYARLCELMGGDKEKIRAFNKKANSGVGGAVLKEMMREAVREKAAGQDGVLPGKLQREPAGELESEPESELETRASRAN